MARHLIKAYVFHSLIVFYQISKQQRVLYRYTCWYNCQPIPRDWYNDQKRVKHVSASDFVNRVDGCHVGMNYAEFSVH